MFYSYDDSYVYINESFMLLLLQLLIYFRDLASYKNKYFIIYLCLIQTTLQPTLTLLFERGGGFPLGQIRPNFLHQ